MKLGRRTLLHLLAAAGLTPAWCLRSGRAETLVPAAKPFFLLFDDIGPDLPAGTLTAALSPFAALGIPVGFVLRTDAGAAPQAWAALAAAIGGFVRDTPGLGEVIAWLPEMAGEPPYFQARAAVAARSRLDAALGASPPPVVSVAGWDRPGPAATDAVRVAGFRNAVLLPGSDGPAASARCRDRTACLRGGLRRRLTDPVAATRPALAAAARSGEAIVLSLSLEGIAALAPEAVHDRAAALALAVADTMRGDQVFAALPREHVLWFGSGTERLVGLRVETPAEGDIPGGLAFAAFAQMLRDAGIGFSASPPAQPGPGGAPVACDAGAGGDAPVCVVAAGLPDDASALLADRGTEIVVDPSGHGRTATLDPNGLLQLTESLSVKAPADLGRNFAATDPVQDVVLSIAAGAYATAPGRAQLLRTLTGTGDETRSTVLALPDFAARILPDDAVYRVMLATRREARGEPAGPADIPPDGRAEFLEDAAIAWNYVARLTEPATGLCPSTAAFDGEWSSYYRFLTMWDLGSLIQAVLAAHELGLIGEADFRTRLAAILDALPAEPVGGLVLPSEEIRTDRRQTSRLGFNACDTGRLLSALHEVDRYPLSAGLGARALARWDIAATVRDRRFHSHTPAGFAPFFLSHCAHYAARALGLWGFDAGSPYDAMQGDSETDARMRLLYAVAGIGAFGAEPLLLEAVEMGFSRPSAWLADVLFTAQRRSFATDGRLVGVSETPLNRAPWFSAQGFAVDGGNAGAWDVQSIDPAPEFDNAAFSASALVVSSKAAFLWAAVRPGPYSGRLLDFVRDRARGSEAGYAAGIYSATGTAMTDYTDINTNGVILQAIAYALRGRRPRHGA